jgi:hypothetical protein
MGARIFQSIGPPREGARARRRRQAWRRDSRTLLARLSVVVGVVVFIVIVVALLEQR